MKCIPCRVTFEGFRYEIARNGTVSLTPQGAYAQMTSNRPVDDAELASRVRREAARQRRNRNARERHSALRSIGMKKTPYGWE